MSRFIFDKTLLKSQKLQYFPGFCGVIAKFLCQIQEHFAQNSER